jgi:hypothetical protein
MALATETSSLSDSEQQGQQDEAARTRFRHAAVTSVLILCSLWFGALVLGAWHHDGRVPGQLSRLFFFNCIGISNKAMRHITYLSSINTCM